MRILLTIASVVVSFGIPLAACVAAEPPPAFVDLPDGAPVASDGGGTDAPPVSCKAPDVNCNNACVKLASSADHCGACGNSCGSAACTAGKCGLAEVRKGIAGFAGFAVAAGTLYFADATTLKSCSAATCASGGTQIAAATSFGAIGVNGDKIAFVAKAPGQSAPALFRCPSAGCGDSLRQVQPAGATGNGFIQLTTEGILYQVDSALRYVDCPLAGCVVNSTEIVGSGVGGFAADKAHMYLRTTSGGASQLAACAGVAGVAGACAAPQKITLPDGTTLADAASTSIVASRKELLYIATNADSSQRVYACTKPNCATSSAVGIVATQIRELAADAKGIYWLASNGGGEFTLFTCADSSCAEKQQALATNLVNPSNLRVDGDFAYFAVRDNAVEGTSIIKRVGR